MACARCCGENDRCNNNNNSLFGELSNMINPNSDSESIASTAMERVGARQKSKHGTSGRFATFIWRRENNSRQECKRNDSANDTKDMEHRLKSPSSSKVSFDFFKNIRKHLQIKNLCKSKQKVSNHFLFVPFFFFYISALLQYSTILLSNFFFRVKRQM